jgi:tripartite-type tricarboxylate transporter receptor subunit TctC
MAMFRTLIAVAAALSLAPALAQDYPAREIRSICNFAPGSGADILVRWYSDQLARLAGKPVVVENKPGAQGTLATDYVAKSRPDGYTIHITPASSTLASAPYMFKKLQYDPQKDFAPVTTLSTLAFTISVDAAKPIHSMADLIQHLKKRPNEGFYGTGSNTGQIAAEVFKTGAKLKTTYVPYKTNAQAISSLLQGEVDFISYDATWAATQQESRGGKLRILAVSSAKRAGALPNPPTLRELGLSDSDVTPWWGVVVPAGTPQPIVEKLEAWFNQIVASEEHKIFLQRASLDPLPGTSASMAKLLREDSARWASYVKLAGIEPQ